MSSPSLTDLQPAAARNPAELIALLRLMKVRSGLNYRQLEARAEAAGDVLPRSTLSAALKRSALPREELLVAFVRACGSDDAEIAEWIDARRRLAEAAVQTSEPAAPEPAPAATPSLALPSEPVTDAKQWAFTWGDGPDADAEPRREPEAAAATPAAPAVPPPPAPAPVVAPPAVPTAPVAGAPPAAVAVPPPPVAPAAAGRQLPHYTAPVSHRLSPATERRRRQEVPPARQPLPALPPRSERGPQLRSLLSWLVPPAVARASFPIRVLIALLVIVLVAAVVGAATKRVRDRIGAASAVVAVANR